MAFEKIIGQDVAVRAIKAMINRGQVRGTYLFLGPDGAGKRTTSLELAKSLNCEVNSGDACDVCIQCKKIDALNHPDIFVIYPQGSSYSIGIDTVRDIIYQASLKPYEAKKRIFIINNAEHMTEEAQNAFLKLLEEPPQNHIFLLTASSITGLLPTVVSRCKVLKFYFLSRAQVQDFLLSKGMDGKEAGLFSHMAMGSIGRALDFKEKNIIPRRDEIVNNFFLRKSAIFREAVLSQQAGKDAEETLYLLLCWYRDILLSKFTHNPDAILNIDRHEEILSYTRRFTKEKLERDISGILRTLEYVRMNINPKIALFNMAIDLKRS